MTLIYILEPSVVHFMETLSLKEIEFTVNVLPHYTGRIFTWHNEGYHRDVGNIDSLMQGQGRISVAVARRFFIRFLGAELG
jgi:mannose-1-phosphate guanylyltransferase